jgi:predicted DNA-binding transcriptional regulator AlpA
LIFEIILPIIAFIGMWSNIVGNLSEENFNMKELVEFLKVDRRTITRWIKEEPNFPKPFKIGRKLLWKRSEIEEYIEKCRK